MNRRARLAAAAAVSAAVLVIAGGAGSRVLAHRDLAAWAAAQSIPTVTLANLQGNGGVYTTDDAGKIVTGPGLSVSGPGGGNEASVTISPAGVPLPTLSAVTAATTAALATTSGTGAVETALKAAVATGSAHLADSSYSVGAPIVINLGGATQGPIDIDFGGAKIQSTIAGGGPVIEIVVGAGVNVSQLTISMCLSMPEACRASSHSPTGRPYLASMDGKYEAGPLGVSDIVSPGGSARPAGP